MGFCCTQLYQETNFTGIAEVTSSYSELELYTCEFTPTFLMVNELKGLTYFVFSIQYHQFVTNCLNKTPSLSKCGELLGPTCMCIVINYQTFHELTKRYFYLKLFFMYNLKLYTVSYSTITFSQHIYNTKWFSIQQPAQYSLNMVTCATRLYQKHTECWRKWYDGWHFQIYFWKKFSEF